MKQADFEKLVVKAIESLPEFIQNKEVVWHEIGHHFGFNEAQVRKLEKKWRQTNS